MSSIRSDIRSLVAKYGLPAVHAELQAEMKETFEFLRQFYGPSKNNLVIPMTSAVIPDRIATPLHKPIVATVQTIEPPSLELAEADEISHDESVQEAPVQVEAPRDPSLKEVVIQAKREMDQGQGSGEKFSKAKHREEVAKKHKELIEKGIRPESLLTKENLSKWLGEGLSYMRIAREHVGIHENEIASLAKTFGLQSNIKQYIVMKKGGKGGA